MKRKYLVILFLIEITMCVSAQIPVGAWRDHLSYHQTKKIAKIGSKLFLATDLNIFTYDTRDNSVQKLSKINGLSDFGVSTIEYYSSKNILLVAYENGNVDLIEDKTITNIPVIKKKIMNGSKKANCVFFRGDYAFLCYSFGIIQLNLAKKEVKDTWYIGENGISNEVYSITADDTYYYAATSKGIYKASLSDPFLVNYSNWIRETNISTSNGRFNLITNYNGVIVANLSGNSDNSDTLFSLTNNYWQSLSINQFERRYELRTCNNKLVISSQSKVYWLNPQFQVMSEISRYDFAYSAPRSAILDETGALWIADDQYGLITTSTSASKFGSIYPNGPWLNDVGILKYANNTIFATGGAVNSSWEAQYHKGSYFSFNNETWSSKINERAYDYLYIAPDPKNASTIYIGSYGTGVWKYVNGDTAENYNASNSPLVSNILGQNYVFLTGLTFDNNNNLWMVCSGVSTPPLVVRKADGTWKSYNLMQAINSKSQGEIMFDNAGQLWMVLPRGEGLFVFDPNQTDEKKQFKKFKPYDIFDAIISNTFCITKDRDGAMWIGTDNGPVYFSNPENILLETGDTKGQQPKIPRKDGSDNVDNVLFGTIINCIAVDGANRKWFGTFGGGAFLFSADGTKQLLHFKMENSPMLSNNIKSIAIHEETGEVFFGTDKGMISYKGSATAPLDDFENVYVYPNPVRPNYNGVITITGLIENCHVKITDISGNLVYAAKSTGGSCVWDGKNRKGRKISSGVYVVFLSNDDGSKTFTTKFVVIH